MRDPQLAQPEETTYQERTISPRNLFSETQETVALTQAPSPPTKPCHSVSKNVPKVCAISFDTFCAQGSQVAPVIHAPPHGPIQPQQAPPKRVISPTDIDTPLPTKQRKLKPKASPKPLKQSLDPNAPPKTRIKQTRHLVGTPKPKKQRSIRPKATPKPRAKRPSRAKNAVPKSVGNPLTRTPNPAKNATLPEKRMILTPIGEKRTRVKVGPASSSSGGKGRASVLEKLHLPSFEGEVDEARKPWIESNGGRNGLTFNASVAFCLDLILITTCETCRDSFLM